MITIKMLKDWLATLGPDWDDAEVQAVSHGIPATCKRVVAYEYKPEPSKDRRMLPKPRKAIVANPMGTHLGDDWVNDTTRHSTLMDTTPLPPITIVEAPPEQWPAIAEKFVETHGGGAGNDCESD